MVQGEGQKLGIWNHSLIKHTSKQKYLPKMPNKHASAPVYV